MHFFGFRGNHAAKDSIARCFDSGRVPHAFLIDGPEGCGKRMLAGIMAAAAVCASDDEKPCGVCRQCRNALSGNHPDIIRVSGGAGARSFSVDQVRAIRMEANVAPNDAEKKVYILSNIHNMTEQAQNALLKILEEPPSFVMFILTCDGKSRVLPTVLSRVQTVAVGPVSEDEAVEALLEQSESLDRETAADAARMSGCVIGRAKAGLESGGFGAARELCGEFSDAVCSAEEYRLLRLTGKLEKDRALFATFLNTLILLLRDAAAARTGIQTRLSGCERESGLLAGRLAISQLYGMLETLRQARRAVDGNVNHTLLLTWLFSTLWEQSH